MQAAVCAANSPLRLTATHLPGLATNLSITHVQRRQRRRRQRGSGRSGAGDGASAEPGTGPSSVADSDPFGSDEEVRLEQLNFGFTRTCIVVSSTGCSLRLYFDNKICL